MKRIILIFFIFLGAFQIKAQDSLIQFSGLVLTSDSLQALPYTTIYIKNKHKGTISNIDGFFSLVVEKGDTLKFSYLGFKDIEYTIPDTLSVDRYSVVQLMSEDTMNLAETVIYPWPTREMFREAFIKAEIPDDDLERARKNLKREKLKELQQFLPEDANETADSYLRQYAKSFYTYGYQPPPNNLLNPFAWAQFIKAWRNGDFKRKK